MIMIPTLSFGQETSEVTPQLATIQSPFRLVPRELGAFATRVVLDDLAYGRLKNLKGKEVIMTNFVLNPGETHDLLLHHVSVFTDDAKIVLGTDTGDRFLAAPDMLMFGGTVKGDPESKVFLSISPHGTHGLILSQGDTYIMSSGRHGAGRDTVIYRTADVPEGAIAWDDFQCDVERLTEGPGLEAAVSPNETAVTAGSATFVVEIAIETDWEFTSALFGGDTAASSAYAATLVGAISEIFTSDVSTELSISYLRVWSTSSDPWNGSGAGAQLTQFREFWLSNMGGVQRDIAHFFSGRGLGGGVAWVSVLCNGDWGFALSANLGGSFPYPLEDHHWQNWDVFVVAHELGHNFGAPHTHGTLPPIDSCGLGDCSAAWGGTIMSYCHTCSGGMTNITLNFHERIATENMVPHVSSSSCVADSGVPLILQHPQSVTGCEATDVILSTVVAGASPLSYQWLKNGTNIPGATLANLTLSVVSPADVGDYSVFVSNAQGSTTSDTATVNVFSQSSPPIDEPSVVAKNRYLSIAPANAGRSTALRVTLTDLPPEYAAYQGQYRWVDEPDDNGYAALTCQPVFVDWAVVAEVIHIGDSAIVPDARYEISAIDQSCGIGNVSAYSPPLSVSTISVWGDIVGPFDPLNNQYSDPDGDPNFYDIGAVIDAFRGVSTGPQVAQADIARDAPDHDVNFHDISAVVEAFQRFPYPFAGPDDCP